MVAVSTVANGVTVNAVAVLWDLDPNTELREQRRHRQEKIRIKTRFSTELWPQGAGPIVSVALCPLDEANVSVEERLAIPVPHISMK